MLTELSIRNLAVIEYVQLRFQQGFHVLTGETGAGKSIIIDALSLAIGSRGSADLVRRGNDKTEIEAVFELETEHPVWDVLARLGLDAPRDELLIIRREVTANGKSSARINGQAVNLTMLREVGEWLVNIHGQHEHQSLLKTDMHLSWLDAYDEQRIGVILEQYHAAYDQYVSLRKELGKLMETNQTTLQMQDLYRYQMEEIAAAELRIGEDQELLEEKKKWSSSEQRLHHVSEAYEWLNGQGRGLDSLRKARQHIEDIAEADAAQLAPLLEQVNEAFYQLEDAAFQLREYRDQIEFNPERLEEIETRLDQLALLRRKYGENIDEILLYLDKITNELHRMDHKEERIAELEQQLQWMEEQLVKLAQQLSDTRKDAAVRLARQIESELGDLHMSRTRFEVRIERTEHKDGVLVDGVRWAISRDGWDYVEFMISANPGEPLRSLGRVASGGELSRIMLALKSIFAQVDRIPVLVFDEVDTGVSGRAAQAIAEKLSALSRNCQVFSITHLPQVACMADAHYAIEKMTEQDRTYTRVQQLVSDERTQELARMLGGVEVTNTTLSHAQEMLAMAIQRRQRAAGSS